MVRIIIGLIAFALFAIIGYFGLPIIYQNAPSYGSITIVSLLILLGIAYLCLARPIRDFIEDHF
jgi:hypothetical protein